MKIFKKSRSTICLIALAFGVSGCVSIDNAVVVTEADPWLQEILTYKESIPAADPDHISQIISISTEMKEVVKQNFSSGAKTIAAKRLANWLIDENGHNMKYNINANFSPVEAFKRREGNCLTFTILLSSLAKELDINIEYNEVDLPDIWDFDEQNGMVLYRHVNAIYVSSHYRQVFDLAIQNYDFGYPQRIISQELAVAKLHSNRAMAFLSNGESNKAMHTIKLALSHSPQSADLWINLGVVYKRQENLVLAEKAFLRSYHLDDGNAMAASNLERLYRSHGKQKTADIFEKAARRARLQNPYYHYNLAKQSYEREQYKQARSSIKKSIKLHSKDARFFELSSRIAQQQNRLTQALRDLANAYKLSVDEEDRDRYASKAHRVQQRAQAIELKRQKTRDASSTYRILGGG